MQIIDLFSGIGGFSLAGRWMGWRTVQFCEIDQFCVQVLSHHFPNTPIHGDVKTLTKEIITSSPTYDSNEDTIVTGGFPCQPFSHAGKREGDDDNRYLWPEMFAIIRSILPTWVVAENVYGIVNWNGGLVFEQVCTDLEEEGYEVFSYLLPAAGIGAPHKRDRIWFVAYRKGGQSRKPKAGNRGEGTKRRGEATGNQHRNAAHTSNERPQGRQEQRGIGEKGREGQYGPDIAGYLPVGWANFPTQPPLCSRDDGVSFGLDRRTFSKWRTESLKAYGNAIVPQVVYQLYRVIEQLNNTKQ